MKTPAISVRKLGILFAGALLLTTGWTSKVRAGLSYGYAEQTISHLTITPSITGDSVTSNSTAAATFNGSGNASSDPLNAPQIYIGGSPAAPQDDFTRYAPGTPTPVSPVGNFTRGDSLIAALSGANNAASVVSESFLNGNGPLAETASSNVAVSLLFTTTTAGALNIGYSFQNDAYVFTNGGSATAHFGFDITIKDLAGNLVFDSATAATNVTLASPPNGLEILGNGTENVVTSALLASTEYSITFSITSGTSVTQPAAVPEPSSIILLGLGGGTVLLMGRRNRSKS
jgi:PEP-CTERM motif